MQKIRKSITKEIDSALVYYDLNNVDRGKNLLAVEAINKIVSNFIIHESALVRDGNNIMIEFLEYETPLKNFPHPLGLDKNPKINLKGKIDRIDVFNDCYRIIDYKTGFVKIQDLQTLNLEEIKSKPKVLQLLLYAWLFSKESKIKKLPILAGIINLRARNFNFRKFSINKEYSIDSILLKEFEQELAKIFNNMFDSKEDFEHLEKEGGCRFCD